MPWLRGAVVTATHPQPRLPGWREVRPWTGPGVLSGAVYEREGVLVISTLALAEYPDGDGIGPQHHVSVSCRGRRPSRSELNIALVQFGMRGTEEDNHHPGIARHFWRPLDPAHRVACQCKSDETVVRDGAYEWTNPVEGPCRGCEYEQMSGRPCPLHKPVKLTP